MPHPTIPHWFWLTAVALVGGCIGSFLNVVIYRTARGLSVRDPARSFCPGCGATIAWCDNVPILSYLLLGGRCRRCRMTISIRYPLVEGLTILLFLLAYDTFFLGRVRPGFTSVPTDWLVFLAHVVLIGALIVTSAIDMEGYWIDVSITYGVVVVGAVTHAFWTPASSAGFPRPWPVTAAGATAAVIGMVMSAFLENHRRVEPPNEAETEDHSIPPLSRSASRAQQIWAWLILGVIAGWFFLAAVDAGRWDDPEGFGLRTALVVLSCFVMMVVAGMNPTVADEEIVEAIHEERFTARRVAMSELLWLSPAIVLGVLAMIGVAWTERGGAAWRQMLDWAPWGGTWRPVLGVTTALGGFVVAGAVGWGVRILFTLLLGKEAFGLGDVHLMGAAGAVAGWPVVVIGFFLACPFAICAVIIWLLRKRSRAVWFGPWLSLGVVVAMAAYGPIAARFGASYEVIQWWLTGR